MFETVDVREKARSQYESFERAVLKSIEDGKKEFPNKDFYVDVIWRINKDGSEEPQQKMVAFQAAPTPHYNQTVYKYHRAAADLELLWTLPTQEDCIEMYHQRDYISVDEWPLLKYVLEYFDGSLFKKVDLLEIEDGTAKFIQ